MQAPSVQSESRHWASLREAGTLAGFRFLLFAHRWLGRGGLSVLLAPVIVYFVIGRPVARRASLDFLRTHQRYFPQQWQTRPGYWQVVRHFKQFADAILDKLLAWSSDLSMDEFDVVNPIQLDQLMNDDRGQLIIGTHMGNLEYCRGFMQRYHEKIINILVYDKHAANFVDMMRRVNPDSRLNIFQVDEFDVATMLRLQNKVESGEWVFIAGDRVPLDGLLRTTEVEFLGRPAALPIGPYMLAKALACPVSLMFAYRQDQHPQRKIRFEVVPFAERVTLARRQREHDLQRYAQQFADQLQAQCQRVPYQWFNFFDFWAKDPRSVS